MASDYNLEPILVLSIQFILPWAQVRFGIPRHLNAAIRYLHAEIWYPKASMQLNRMVLIPLVFTGFILKYLRIQATVACLLTLVLKMFILSLTRRVKMVNMTPNHTTQQYSLLQKPY